MEVPGEREVLGSQVLPVHVFGEDACSHSKTQLGPQLSIYCFNEAGWHGAKRDGGRLPR